MAVPWLGRIVTSVSGVPLLLGLATSVATGAVTVDAQSIANVATTQVLTGTLSDLQVLILDVIPSDGRRLQRLDSRAVGAGITISGSSWTADIAQVNPYGLKPGTYQLEFRSTQPTLITSMTVQVLPSPEQQRREAQRATLLSVLPPMLRGLVVDEIDDEQLLDCTLTKEQGALVLHARLTSDDSDVTLVMRDGRVISREEHWHITRANPALTTDALPGRANGNIEQLITDHPGAFMPTPIAGICKRGYHGHEYTRVYFQHVADTTGSDATLHQVPRYSDFDAAGNVMTQRDCENLSPHLKAIMLAQLPETEPSSIALASVRTSGNHARSRGQFTVDILLHDAAVQVVCAQLQDRSSDLGDNLGDDAPSSARAETQPEVPLTLATLPLATRTTIQGMIRSLPTTAPPEIMSFRSPGGHRIYRLTYCQEDAHRVHVVGLVLNDDGSFFGQRRPPVVSPAMGAWARSQFPDASTEQLQNGREVDFEVCTSCHAVISPYQLNATDWPGVIQSMMRMYNQMLVGIRTHVRPSIGSL